MKILLDGDGVLFDFVGALRRFWHACSIEPFPRIQEWDLRSSLPPEFLAEALSNPHFAGAVMPYHMAPEFARALRRRGHIVDCVTAPCATAPGWKSTRYAALVEMDAFMDVHFEHDKGRVRGDILFDDKPENLFAFKAANPDGVCVLAQHEYNEISPLPDGTYRISMKKPELAYARFVAFVDGIATVRDAD